MGEAKARIEVFGAPEIIAALKEVGTEAADNLEPVVHSGAEPVTEDAKRFAPKRTRNLAEHIKQETLEKSETEVEVGVGPDDKEAAWYGLWVEMGTDPHWVPREKGKNIVLRIGNRLTGATILHPGANEQPFLRPAFDGNVDLVLETIGEELRKVVKIDD